MDTKLAEKIQADPNYQTLVSKRNAFSVSLSIFMLVMFYVYILVIAFEPSLLATKIGGGIMTVAFPIGAAIIIISFLVTLIYVKKANGEYEDLTNKIKDNVKDLV